MRENLVLFATYNAEMNLRNFHAAQKLSAEELLQDRGAFFGSIMGTLNHLIAADTIWLQRIAHHPSQFSSLLAIQDSPKPTGLNQNRFTDLASWFEHRLSLDQIIKQLVLEITEADLESILHYTRTDGVASNKRLKDVLQHFFNHQTHHRGQISTLLFQAGVDVGVTDLLSLVPNVE
ncbi:DinB family protein [Solimicrobium silvestre]|uniref:DinB family n=1 Tax=Solimicrobium silvestre TaxID=2099400 RepID=A0A2S9H006_9BURK|nr:DinB family protein [Solimicrobium silvestre]PRC93278.1 hypothetical protein S2091_2016 [Solimicrobium silvestre]